MFEGVSPGCRSLLRLRILISLTCSFAVLCLGVANEPVGASTKVPKPVALIFGDSLVWESTASVKKEVKKDAGQTLKIHVFAAPGTAPCDWLQTLSTEIKKYKPITITISSVGNSATPCMNDPDTGKPWPVDSSGYLNRYHDDLASFFSIASGSGADVVFSEGAPISSPSLPVWNQAVIDVADIAQKLISTTPFPAVTFSNAARFAVSYDGTYTPTMPCLPGETKGKGCTNDLIVVRTVANTYDRGVHLCPEGLNTDGRSYGCAGYSSGEVRYGSAIADATVAAARLAQSRKDLTAQ